MKGKVVMENKRKYNSIIFAMFFAETFICGIINSFVKIQNISVFVVCILILMSLLVQKFIVRYSEVDLFVIGIIFFLFIFSYVVNRDYCTNYFLYFIVFGITSFYFMQIPIDLKYVFRVLHIIFFIYLITYFLQRGSYLNSSDYWEKQMGFSFGAYMIIVVEIVNYIFCKNERNFLPFIDGIAAAFILFIDSGTRGSIVALLIFVALFLIYKRKKKAGILLLLFGIIAVILYQNSVAIITILNSSLNNIGIKVEAISKTLFKLNNGGTLLNGRDSLYSMALKCIEKNPLIGVGIGGFEKLSASSISGRNYTHQYFLEILCEYGVIGAAFIILFYIKPIKKIFFETHENSIYGSGSAFLGFLLFSSSMPMLMFNNSYWLLPSFWLFFAWCVNQYRNV